MPLTDRADSDFREKIACPYTARKTTDLSPQETKTLQTQLDHKLRLIPAFHLPSLTLYDIQHRTPRTHLANIPADINLAFLLRNRTLIDTYDGVAFKETSGQPEDIARAIWFYRLDALRQFQRWHDGVRWNIALFTALLAHHTGRQQERERCDSSSPSLSPAAVRFIKLYLAAVQEHHAHPSVFTAREAFIAYWRASPLDLFSVHRAWARKALQRALKQLAREWEVELARAREEMGREAYDVRVAPLVGSLIPGRPARALGGEAGLSGEVDDGDELLDALRVPCPVVVQSGDERRMVQDTDAETVCDLRSGISCVQSVRPKDMLSVLLRFFSPVD